MRGGPRRQTTDDCHFAIFLRSWVQSSVVVPGGGTTRPQAPCRSPISIASWYLSPVTGQRLKLSFLSKINRSSRFYISYFNWMVSYFLLSKIFIAVPVLVNSLKVLWATWLLQRPTPVFWQPSSLLWRKRTWPLLRPTTKRCVQRSMDSWGGVGFHQVVHVNSTHYELLGSVIF